MDIAPVRDVTDNYLPEMHAPTSRKMRAKALPRSGTFRMEILTMITETGTQGMTDYDLEDRLQRSHQSVSATRNGLVADGWLEPAVHGDGTPRVRQNQYGNDAQVWVAASAAEPRLAPVGPDRLTVMDLVLDCVNCELHTRCTAPVFMSGPTPNRWVILGEAPGRQEDKQGVPFVGPAGEILRDHLTQVGFDPDQTTFINTVSCFPDGTPEWEHVNACEQNRVWQLELADPKFVLCVGKVATKAINRSLDMKHGRGRPWLGADGRVYMATYHPAAALRNTNIESAMHDDLVTFAEMIAADDWMDFVRFTCSACPLDMCWMGADHLVWCEAHLPAIERVARDRFRGTLV